MGKFIAGYIGSVLLLIATVIAFILFLVSSLGDFTNQPHYIVPGSHTIEFNETGNFTIFHVYTSKEQGIRNQAYALDHMNFFLVDESNDTLYTSQVLGNSTFSGSGTEGKGIRSFKITTPQTSTLFCDMDRTDHLDNGKAVIVILRNFTKSLLTSILVGFVIMGGGMLLSFALLIFTIIKHIMFVQNRKETT